MLSREIKYSCAPDACKEELSNHFPSTKKSKQNIRIPIGAVRHRHSSLSRLSAHFSIRRAPPQPVSCRSGSLRLILHVSLLVLFQSSRGYSLSSLLNIFEPDAPGCSQLLLCHSRCSLQSICRIWSNIVLLSSHDSLHRAQQSLEAISS